MTDFLYPPRRELPNRKRCKTRHSPRTPARCKHPRDHEGDHWFGTWRGNGYTMALDTLLPDLVRGPVKLPGEG